MIPDLMEEFQLRATRIQVETPSTNDAETLAMLQILVRLEGEIKDLKIKVAKLEGEQGG